MMGTRVASAAPGAIAAAHQHYAANAGLTHELRLALTFWLL